MRYFECAPFCLSASGLISSATLVCSLPSPPLGSPSGGDQPVSHHPTGGIKAPLYLPHNNHYPSSTGSFSLVFNQLVFPQRVFL